MVKGKIEKARELFLRLEKRKDSKTESACRMFKVSEFLTETKMLLENKC